MKKPDAVQTFAANVRRLREERGLSQARLAEQSDLNMTDISRIERRRREPGISVLVKLARGLSVPIDELFDGIDTVGEGSRGK